MHAPKWSPLTPTEEQSHILSLVRSTSSNLLIDALAGCGKTSTLEMIQDACPPPVLCLAFNRRIADTMVRRFKSTTTVRTFNSLGHRIWASTSAGKVSLDPKKCQALLRELISPLPKPKKGEAYDLFWDILSAVGLAKSLGYIPRGVFPNATRLIDLPSLAGRFDEIPSSLFLDLLDQTLIASIKAAYAGNIDYNDQVYMPALFGGTYPKHPTVLVDEAQDLNPVNHEMLSHLAKSRIIAVGDPRQSVYGFRGAVQGGMKQLRERFAMEEANLSVTFRCPRKVVELARWRAPHMQWRKEGGIVGEIRNPTPSAFPDGCAIICRNNAPLFAVALRLLSCGRSVSVSGSEVGPKIVGILRKLGPTEMKQEEVLNAIESWRAEKLAKQSTTAGDIADSLRVFAERGENLGLAIAYAEDLFKQQGTIFLLTGHKAKGLEWQSVYHLDPFLLREDEQDRNLYYVIQTRAEEAYYEILSKEIRWAA